MVNFLHKSEAASVTFRTPPPPTPPGDLIAAGSRVDVRWHDYDDATWHTGVARSTQNVLRLIEGSEALCLDFRVDFDDDEPMQWCSRSTHDIWEAAATAGEVEVASERDGKGPEPGMDPAAHLSPKSVQPDFLRRTFCVGRSQGLVWYQTQEGLVWYQTHRFCVGRSQGMVPNARGPAAAHNAMCLRARRPGERHSGWARRICCTVVQGCPFGGRRLSGLVQRGIDHHFRRHGHRRIDHADGSGRSGALHRRAVSRFQWSMARPTPTTQS